MKYMVVPAVLAIALLAAVLFLWLGSDRLSIPLGEDGD